MGCQKEYCCIHDKSQGFEDMDVDDFDDGSKRTPRSRKKSAKVKEMEEASEYERQVVASKRQRLISPKKEKQTKIVESSGLKMTITGAGQGGHPEHTKVVQSAGLKMTFSSLPSSQPTAPSQVVNFGAGTSIRNVVPSVSQDKPGSLKMKLTLPPAENFQTKKHSPKKSPSVVSPVLAAHLTSPTAPRLPYGDLEHDDDIDTEPGEDDTESLDIENDVTEAEPQQSAYVHHPSVQETRRPGRPSVRGRGRGRGSRGRGRGRGQGRSPSDPGGAGKGYKKKRALTAYLMWTSEMRPRLMAQMPQLDFAAVSKKLGEIWASMPEKEKTTWKRKAKRKQNQENNVGTGLAPTKPVPKQRSNFVRGGGAFGERNISKSNVSALPRPVGRPPSLHNLDESSYKVTNCEPIDVAAHLKLLGESLTIIGHRLKESHGQIAVSGSMSVLLDSMLCALGPLTALTNQVPQLAGAYPNEGHISTLDNIAYIMPVG